MSGAGPILFLFLDGVGLAPESVDNPLATAPSPTLRSLLGGPLTLERVGHRADLLLAPLDATLGVEGLPQSATGQTTLFTGINAAAALGRHVTALPGPRLRAMLAEHSFLRRLTDAGRRVTFANPYPPGYADGVRRGDVRAGATTWATLAADLPLRGLVDLAAGRAVSWDVTGERIAARTGRAVSPVEPGTAGARLAALAREHDLVLWETFLTDLAGHRREPGAAAAIDVVDRLLGGVVAALPAEATLLVTSDHGNLEDATTRSHTRNPVPLLVVGPLAAAFAGLVSIAEVAPRIVAVLGVD